MSDVVLEALDAIGSIDSYNKSFKRQLRLDGKSKSTQVNYPKTVERFAEFLRSKGMPTNVHSIKREHVEAYIDALLGDSIGPAPVQTPRNYYYYHLKAFFNFLVNDYEEIQEVDHPMRKTKPPAVVERVVNKADDIDIRRILDTCSVPRGTKLPSGRVFLNLRDEAIIRVLIDAGPRRSEVAQLSREVDLDRHVTVVLGKGSVERGIIFGAKTARSLDKYLIARSRHRHARLEALWLANRGQLTADGIYQMLTRRAARVGIHMTPHQLRHAWGHSLKMSGMRDEELMVLGGWRSHAMMRHYGKSAAAERAAAAHERMSPGDRF